MKRLTIFVLIFIAVMPMYADWKIGQMVDEFGDPTGEEFIYTIVDGTFSNSATTGSSAPTRIRANLLSAESPRVQFWFEPHDYSFDNPVNEYYSKSKSTMRFKLESGEVVSSSASNEDLFGGWNAMHPVDAPPICDELINGREVKAVIYVENSTYRFNIPGEGFSEGLDYLFNSMKPEFNIWMKHESSSEEDYITNMLSLILGESYVSPSVYNYKVLEDFNGGKALVTMSLTNSEYAEEGYIKPSFYGYWSRTYEHADLIYERLEVSRVRFQSATDELEFLTEAEDYDSSYYQRLKNTLAGGEVTVTLLIGSEMLQFVVNGSDMLVILNMLEEEAW